jgi:hypothetical protein
VPKAQRPPVLRGDIVFGGESVLREAEAREQPYLTTLRLMKHGTALIKTVFRSNEWEEAGHGWVNVNRGIQEVRTECGDLFDERTSSLGVFHRWDKI